MIFSSSCFLLPWGGPPFFLFQPSLIIFPVPFVHVSFFALAPFLFPSFPLEKNGSCFFFAPPFFWEHCEPLFRVLSRLFFFFPPLQSSFFLRKRVRSFLCGRCFPPLQKHPPPFFFFVSSLFPQPLFPPILPSFFSVVAPTLLLSSSGSRFFFFFPFHDFVLLVKYFVFCTIGAFLPFPLGYWHFFPRGYRQPFFPKFTLLVFFFTLSPLFPVGPAQSPFFPGLVW